jgi:hypothetical protein
MKRHRDLRLLPAILVLAGALLCSSFSLSDERSSRGPATPTPKPALSTEGPLTAKQVDLKIDLRPDLVVDLKATATYIYPVYVTVKNAGLTKSAAAVLKVSCDQYKGSTKLGPCLSKIEASIPGLDPGKQVMPTLPFAPGLHCVDPDKKGITLCRVTARLLIRRGASEKSTANNKQTLDVAAWK